MGADVGRARSGAQPAPSATTGSDTGRGRFRGGHWGPILAAAVRSPRDVGTLVPSGPELARRLACVVPRVPLSGRCPVIVEVGAGDGAVTGAIVTRAPQDATVIAIEKDTELAARLRERQPRVQVVAADAIDLRAILAERGVDRADVIVSVLPWTLLGPQRQRELLGVFASSLRADGVFTAAAYSAAYWTRAARRFREELGNCFGEVLPTRTLWRHLPPAMSYVCRYPRSAAHHGRATGGDQVSGDQSR